jgi:hypothetical protein
MVSDIPNCSFTCRHANDDGGIGRGIKQHCNVPGNGEGTFPEAHQISTEQIRMTVGWVVDARSRPRGAQTVRS